MIFALLFSPLRLRFDFRTVVNITFALTFLQLELLPTNSILLESNNSSETLLHIYFINLDESKERRKQFETNIENLPRQLLSIIRLTRIPAFSGGDVKAMMTNRTFILNGTKSFLDSSSSHEWWNRQYSYQEVACTLSHLKAIRQAFYDGHNSTMIVEDDAILSPLFLESWKVYASFAPFDWKILQWTTNNAAINMKESHRSNDFWLSWSGHHWSTIAYTVRRSGMRRILRHTSNYFSGQNKDETVWFFEEPEMLSADQLIYFIGRNTYTSSHAWVTPFSCRSTVNNNHIRQPYFGQSNHVPVLDKTQKSERTERIAIIQNMRVSNAKDLEDEMETLLVDMKLMQMFSPSSKWFVKIVLTKSGLISGLRRTISQVASHHAEFQVCVSKERFNKFLFVLEMLDEIPKFDLLLLKDNDIRLAGFEWNTFLMKSNMSIISGPYRWTVERTTSRYKKKIHEIQRDSSVFVNLQDASLFNTYQDAGFQHVSSNSVMTLEEFMVLLRSDFSTWFFKKILTRHFLSQDIDWGPDLMWCKAAYKYSHFNHFAESKDFVPCTLISVNVVDKDTKQILKAKETEPHQSYVKRGNQVVEKFKENCQLKGWIDASNRPVLNYRWLRQWCLENSTHERTGDCLKDYHKERVKMAILNQWENIDDKLPNMTFPEDVSNPQQ